MLIDYDNRQFQVLEPRTFTGLMGIYESNWRLLGKLTGDLRSLPREAVSAVPEDVDLHLEILEESPYTTTFRLTYYFEVGSGLQADPDLTVRVYHDANLAEVLSCKQHHRHRLLQQFPTDAKSELKRRWQRNVLLNKWLEYCIERGHAFDF